MKQTLFILFILYSIFTLAENNRNPYATANIDFSSTGKDSKYETLDMRRGDVSFEIPIVSLPVTGKLKLDTAISFNKVPSMAGFISGSKYDVLYTPGVGMGNWNFEIPRIIGARYADYVCGRGTGFILVLPGEAPRKFFVNQKPDLFPGASYVSLDNWVARCKATKFVDPYQGGDSYWGNYVSTGDFEILSPTGLVYNFERMTPTKIEGFTQVPNFQTNRNHGEGDSVPGTQPPFYAKSISDNFGNWINFNFDDNFLSSITTSQLQKIEIFYKNITISGKPLYGGNGIANQSVKVLDSVTFNKKKWTLNYDLCADTNGTGCFDINYEKYAPWNLQKYILRSMSIPDGQLISFKYMNLLPVGPEDFYRPRPGRHFQLASVQTPNNLLTEYYYSPTCSYVFDGMPPSFDVPYGYVNGLADLDGYTSSLAQAFCTYTLSLNLKKQTGTGINRPLNYYYIIPNITDSKTYLGLILSKKFGHPDVPMPPAPGDPLSYTIELDLYAQKMTVYKFRRDPAGGDLRDPFDPNLFDTNLLLEKSIFPSPSADSPDIGQPAVLPVPPPFPPSLTLQSPNSSYAIGSSITINSSAAGAGIPMTMTCLLNQSMLIPCFAGSPISIASLGQGTYTLTVTVTDAMGNRSEPQTISIQVGDRLNNAPVLISDLVTKSVIPGQPVELGAVFSGTVTKYDWYKNGILISSSSDPKYRIASFELGQAGFYKVIAFNGAAFKASSTVELKIDISALIAVITQILQD